MEAVYERAVARALAGRRIHRRHTQRCGGPRVLLEEIASAVGQSTENTARIAPSVDYDTALESATDVVLRRAFHRAGTVPSRSADRAPSHIYRPLPDDQISKAMLPGGTGAPTICDGNVETDEHESTENTSDDERGVEHEKGDDMDGDEFIDDAPDDEHESEGALGYALGREGGNAGEALVYGTRTCHHCKRACALLDDNRMGYTFIDIGMSGMPLHTLVGQDVDTVPQIVIGGVFIGGYDDLRLHLNGDPMIHAAAIGHGASAAAVAVLLGACIAHVWRT